jgi:ribonuclease HI
LGKGPAIAQGSKTLGDKQTAFDAELTAVEAAFLWYEDNRTTHPHLIIHSDSQSAIARSEHCGAGPGQRTAKSIQRSLVYILRQGRSANIVWVKGHIGIPGNERADKLAGQAAGRVAWSRTSSLSHLKLRISERFREAKIEWHKNPKHHGKDEIPPPAPKMSCIDGAHNFIAQAAAQITTGHWRSATYLKRIKKRTNDDCWFCKGGAAMTRSHVLLHCPSARMSGQDGSVGRKGPRRTAFPSDQPQVGEEIAEVSGALRGRKNCSQWGKRGGGLGTKNGRIDCLGGRKGWGAGPINIITMS